MAEAFDLLVDQVKTIINRQIFADVVDDEVKAPLENPRGSEESRPCLYGIIEDLGLTAHEEAWVSANLAKIRVTHLRLDDRVDKVQSERMFFHAHGVEII